MHAGKEEVLPEPEYVELAVEVFSMLADATRVRIVLALADLGELPVNQLADLLEKSPAAVVIPSSPEGKEIAGRLAIKTGSGFLTDVTDISPDGTTAINHPDGFDIHGNPVVAAEGYPASPRTGDAIEGLFDAAELDGVAVIHAGTRSEGGQVLTAGGRVLAVTAVGADVADARAKAYAGVDAIRIPGSHHRTDIAAGV